jgi:ferric iron reductase protein FhuF
LPDRAGAEEVRAALRRAGQINALLTFADPGSGGDAATAFAASPLIDGIGAWLGTRERRVAASLVVLGYSVRLVGPTVAVLLADGLLIDARPAAVRYSFAAGQGFRLALAAGTEGWLGDDVEVLADRWRAEVIDDHLGAIVDAVRADTPVAAGLLWGNVASGLIGALGSLARAGAVAPDRCADFAMTALADGVLAGSGLVHLHGDRLTFRRRSCCLYYRLPGGGYCADCPLPIDPDH